MKPFWRELQSAKMSSLDDIPKPLTKLIRLIMRGFYNIEQKLVIDMLVRRRETKEDDLVEVLKFERKHLRSLIQQMRQDKFINVRLIMETDEDGKSTRRNYYSINYRMFVNVVKYKIDHMRRKLETEERDLTSRASFICQSCKKTFTDLESGQIFDPIRREFRCSYCDGLVDEDPNVRPQADSRLVMANFNQQMEPIYALLQETENINWSINEADRNNITVTNSTSAGVANNSNGSGLDATNATNGSLTSDQQSQGLAINGNAQDNYLVNINGLEDKYKQEQKSKGPVINPEVEALLLREESLVNSSTTVQESSHDEDETTYSMLMINVGETKVPVDKVSDEHVELMTPQQRQEYERLMQQIYNLMYD